MTNIETYPVAQLRLRNASYSVGEVLYFVEPKLLPSPFVPAELCNHDDVDHVAEGETSRVCPVCVSAWAVDYEVYLPFESLGLA